MILTDYYKTQKLTKAKCRYDVIEATGEYDHFESLLINKRGFNVGGLSINLVERPDRWGGKKNDYALTKGSSNITTLKRPDIESPISLGDIKGTNDACIMVFNSDYKTQGVVTIEIFIARGQKNDRMGLWSLFTDGELDFEIEALRVKSVTKCVTGIAG